MREKERKRERERERVSEREKEKKSRFKKKNLSKLDHDPVACYLSVQSKMEKKWLL